MFRRTCSNGMDLSSIWPTELDKYSEEQRKIITNMPMTIGEIVRNWKQSNKKKQDISRLSELNAVTKDFIKMIIEMETGQMEKKVPAKTKITQKFSNIITEQLENIEEEIKQLQDDIAKITIELESKRKEIKECEKTYEQMVRLMEETEVEDKNENGESKCND